MKNRLSILRFLFCAGSLLVTLCVKGQPCPQPGDSLFVNYYSDIAKSKVRDLGDYLSIITDRKRPDEMRREAITNALSLFLTNEELVWVSNIRDTTKKISYKAYEYLRQMRLLTYEKVEIEWVSLLYVSDLHLGTDGNYYGVIQFSQKFRGYSDGRVVYEDLTTKKNAVVLKANQVFLNGKEETCWDVYLSDIEVVETLPYTYNSSVPKN